MNNRLKEDDTDILEKEANKKARPKCPHNKLKTYCKDCGGGSLCVHGKRKPRCIDCGGSYICVHKKRKNQCKDCNGFSICVHKKRKTVCKECKGTSICSHNKVKSKCKDCNGSQICIHKNLKQQCKKCKGSRICEHNIYKPNCKLCKGSQICEHNIQRPQCKKCKGSQVCIHNNLKSQCKECEGNAICIHKQFKPTCIICSPNSKYYCSNCRLIRVDKRTNFLCSYCNPKSSKRTKTKEFKLKLYLEQFYEIIHNKSCRINNECQLYFPDFIIEQPQFFIIIECDEFAHSSYDKTCEKIRENNICFNLGLPCVFIRFNPDKKKDLTVKMKTKLYVLKSYIDYYISKETCDNTVEYLFY